MGNINRIQNAIMQLEGGAFQKLFDAYLYKKYKFNNIQTLGVQTGTNKPTKGTPDSYVLLMMKIYLNKLWNCKFKVSRENTCGHFIML